MKRLVLVVLLGLAAVCVASSDMANDEDRAGTSLEAGGSAGWVSTKPAGCRPSRTNPQICRLKGVVYRYRNRRAVKRRGRWYRSKRSQLVWKRGRWVKARGSARHPTDPRYKRVAGRWVRRPAAKTRRYVRVKGLWWRSKAQKRFWWRARWNRPVWLKPRNDPRRYRIAATGKWGYRLRHKFVLWQGIWLRRKGSRRGYWNGKWVSLRRLIGGNPNFRRNRKGKWRNVSLRRPTTYALKWGKWFRSRRSPLYFRNRKWTLYSTAHWNNPTWRMTRQGRWRRLPSPPGAAAAAVPKKGQGGFFWRGNNLVFYHGRWIPRRALLRAKRARAAMRTLRTGGIPADMRQAIKAQVFDNFSRFMKWFISNYLRGGNGVRRARLARNRGVPYADRLDPGTPVRQTSAATTKALRDWVVDGKLRDPLRATITHAERNAIRKANRIRADVVSDGRKASAATFLQTGNEADVAAATSADEVGSGVFAAAPTAVDPTLPAALNGGNQPVKTSQDPSLGGTQQ
jgi:hypothetical protein